MYSGHQPKFVGGGMENWARKGERGGGMQGGGGVRNYLIFTYLLGRTPKPQEKVKPEVTGNGTRKRFTNRLLGGEDVAMAPSYPGKKN